MMRTLFLDALSCQNQSRPPVWLMRQAGRYMQSYQALRKKYSFSQLCLIPELAAQVTLQPIQTFDVDAAILFSDILFPLSTLGYDISFSPRPTISGPPWQQATSPVDIEAALKENIGGTYTAASLLCESLDRALIGFAGAPWTLAAYLIEGGSSRGGSSRKWSKVQQALQKNLNEVISLVSCLEPIVTTHLRLQIQAGCNALQLFDSQNALLPPPLFKTLCLLPLKRILSELDSFPLIYFKAASSNITSLSSIAPLSVDQTISLNNIRHRIPHHLAIQGNLDISLLQEPKKAIATAQQICTCMQHDPGFIFNLSGGIPPTTKEETVRRLVETVQNS